MALVGGDLAVQRIDDIGLAFETLKKISLTEQQPACDLESGIVPSGLRKDAGHAWIQPLLLLAGLDGGAACVHQPDQLAQDELWVK